MNENKYSFSKSLLKTKLFNAPKLEDIELMVNYAITINPEFQPTNHTRAGICIWYNKMTRRFREEIKDIEMTLNLEGSPSARLHFHGIVNFKTYEGYFSLIDFLAEGYSSEIDTIGNVIEDYEAPADVTNGDDFEKWQRYCYKQYHIWKHLLRKWQLEYPLHIIGSPIINTLAAPADVDGLN